MQISDRLIMRRFSPCMRFIGPLAAGLIGAGAGAGLSSIFGGGGDEVDFRRVPESKEAIEARKKLSQISKQQPPAIPRRQIAPLPPITEERQLARETAKELAQPVDIFSLPEVQGIIEQARETGNLLANRLGRALQAAGTFTTSPGRDILGRAVTSVQKNLAASLAPFASEERARRRGLIPTLEGLGLTEEERQRGVTQAEKDALFQQEFAKSQQLQSFTIPILQSLISSQPSVLPILSGQQPSTFSQIAPLIGPLLTAALGSGAPQAGGAGIFSPAGASFLTEGFLGGQLSPQF